MPAGICEFNTMIGLAKTIATRKRGMFGAFKDIEREDLVHEALHGMMDAMRRRQLVPSKG